MMVIPVNRAVVSFLNTVPLSCGTENASVSCGKRVAGALRKKGLASEKHFTFASHLFLSGLQPDRESSILFDVKNHWASEPSSLRDTKTILHANPG